MRIRDDAFLNSAPPPPPRPRRMTALEKASLEGIGDRHFRQAQDYFLSQGGTLVPGGRLETVDGPVSVGDRVEFLAPDGRRIAGVLDELAPQAAVVMTEPGEYLAVPHHAIRPEPRAWKFAELRKSLRSIVAHGHQEQVSETREPIAVNASQRDFAITIQGWSVNKPTDDEILEYVAARYPAARILDADDTYPGNKVSVVLHFPNGLHATAQMDGGDTERGNGDGAGLPDILEDTEGMGAMHNAAAPTPRADAVLRQVAAQSLTDRATERVVEYMSRLAAAQPAFDFVETSFEEREGGGVISHFAVLQDGAPVYLRVHANGQKSLTTVLASGAAPAVGCAMAIPAGPHGHAVRAMFHGPQGEVDARVFCAEHDDMYSPVEPTHEDEPDTYETGSYATRASAMPHEAAPPHRTPGKPGDYYTQDLFQTEQGRYEKEREQAALAAERAKQRRLQQSPVTLPAPTWPPKGPGGTTPPTQDMGVQDLPEWMEDAPLHQQVHKGGEGEDAEDAEHIAGPGLQLAQRQAADAQTEEYWTQYFDTPETEGYGDALTRDVKRKKVTKDTITAAWQEAGERLTAAQLFGTMRLLLQPAPVTAGRRAQAIGGDLASSLAHSRSTNPAAANAIDKLVADYIARNPEELDRLQVYDQALSGAIKYWEAMQPKRIEQLRQKYAPEQAEIGTATQPGMLTRMQEAISPQKRLQREVDTDAVAGPRGAPIAPTAPAAAPRTPAPQPPGAAPRPAPRPASPAAPGSAANNDGPLDLGLTDDDAAIDLGAYGFDPSESPGSPQTPPAGAARMPETDDDFAINFGDPAGAPPAPQGAPAAAPAPAPAPGGAGAGRSKTFTPVPGMSFVTDRGQPMDSVPPNSQIIRKFPNGAIRVRTPSGQIVTAFPPAGTPYGRSAARGEKYGPSYSAHDPTPGTYADETMGDAYAGRIQPTSAANGFQLENLRRRGDYIVGDVVWDPDRLKAMSAKNIEENIVSFVKAKSTHKDLIDLGHIGRVRVRTIDLQAGIAEVNFRSTESRALPPEQIVVDEGVTHHAPIY